jgi:hypothetical protein
MRSCLHLILVTAVGAGLSAGVRAQPPRFSFADGRPGWMDVELLLQNASVARELKLDGRRELLARRAIFTALPFYTQEVQKVYTLPKDQQRARQLELLDRYQEAQYRALARVLTKAQLRRLKQVQVWVAEIDAFAQPWVAKELRLTGQQKDKIEALAKELEADKKENRAGIGDKLKKFLDHDQLRQLKSFQDAGAGIGAVSQPSVQMLLRLSRQQKEKVKVMATEIKDAVKKVETLVRETMKKAQDILTSDQRRKWQVMAGKPFKLQVRFGNARP